ncbi:hypothetical protein DFH28DRAFT_418391 [Melampsora americana]|nr:hypothetical protein DFH28DRAFT_418391 [Melampsora americana]
MMTIVIPKNDQKVETKIYNAQLMESKYGIVGEEIISAAWDCQKKYGTYEPDFSFNITDKRSQTHTECVFNMPICDLTIPGIHDIWVKTGSVARACKQLGRPA